jgi:hypothetical protein
LTIAKQWGEKATFDVEACPILGGENAGLGSITGYGKRKSRTYWNDEVQKMGR